MADELTPGPDATQRRPSAAFPAVLAVLFLLATPVSYVGAYDRLTWWLETLPALLALPALALAWPRWRLSNLLLVFIFLHALILLTGGHYTYARVPLGDWAAHAFGWTRNNFDKLGHLAQGFVPALLTREILLRWSPFRQTPRSLFVPVMAVACPLAFSAFYEIIEWWVALATGTAATDFLGTQGDPWDTQSDMLFALVGALAAVTLMGRAHDRSIARVEGR
ncbi:DUF2238 domain-containing protein [Alsobacter sp. SYSU M60028]|uniref:DUF2238 domain-containing protein n=1 Tax=Alsobacter ponti TaxID=2962936 RepID=A0ABT1LEC1_9HYPH|nr:DUF2238 domain-containing protein [Alsobacter ponti]MCP8939852.1 DUF2238 domain-containing protein [Alsobacter ponti]